MQGPAFAEMITKVHRGQSDSWGTLLAQLAPRLIAYFERLGIDHHLAEDLTQEVLATVFGKLDGLRDPSRFVAWVRSIARNRMRSRMRRAHFTEMLDDDVLEGRDAMDRVYDADLRRLVFEEVRRFGAPVRRMLELKLLEERTPSEIATLMGIPKDLFRRRFHVALKALRRRVQVRLDGVFSRDGGARPENRTDAPGSHSH